MFNIIWNNVRRQRASLNTKYHCLYGFLFLGLSRKQLSEIYGKSKSTISSWIISYEQNGIVSRKERKLVYRRFGIAKRQWIVKLYMTEPTLFLDEAQKRFFRNFGTSISRSSIVRILYAEGMSWKKLERQAIQIHEVAFDSRDMLRNRGYGFVGEKLIFRDEFRRRPRISTLCFLGQGGLLDSFITKGTFTRKKFFESCRMFGLQSGSVETYPGFYSVWVMDGLLSFKKLDCTRIMRKGGYSEGGKFDPKVGLSQSMKTFDFCTNII